MIIIKQLSRLGALLVVLGATAAACAGAASAATAVFPYPGGVGPVPSPEPVLRTVVVGGMPGWQIALIAATAALVAAIAAVLADRIRSARRRPLSQPA